MTVLSTSKMGSGTERRDPEALFLQISIKAKELGIHYSQLENLSSLKLIKKPTNYDANPKRRIWFASLVCIVVVITYYSLYTREGFTRVMFYWNDVDERGELCTIDMPPSVNNMFLPSLGCSHCSNLAEIQRISGISPEYFEKMYAYTGVPVVISDATVNWTAPHVFSFEFFKSLYYENSFTSSKTRMSCQFFPYKTEFNHLEEVFEMSEDRALMKKGTDPWYIGWGNCDPNVANLLRTYYQRPYFLPPLSEATKMDWIFMGSPGYGANMHIDKVNYPSWQAQIKGKKRWILEPVPECYLQCKTLEIVVESGEIIVLDTNLWYHQTLIVGDEMSITIGAEFD
ncbi:uncharacterized protein [Centruroides vittatus]|uniref:uncharacterized protein n=1 Tax=Centruroides vittatus TaxID=120091 RepID=UPI00350EECE7